mmetsp:Transcript_12750/g.11305  ORF Transcript_12750/g.11305 Transcript_12750/m.11305 type:complete len:141 (+) Transcript_12750:920-1342(+)
MKKVVDRKLDLVVGETVDTEKEKQKDAISSTIFDLPSINNRFSKMYELQYWTNSKTGRKNRLYACKFSGCKKDFYKKWNCTEHYKTHTEEKPYECTACDMVFAQRGSLFKHIKAKVRKGENHGYDQYLRTLHNKREDQIL